MIKAILFDCFGVLTDSSWDQLLTGLDDKQKQSVQDLRRAFDRGIVDYQEFEDQVKEISEVDSSRLREVFLLRQGFQKNTALLKLIDELHKTYKTGVLSNAGTDWLRDEFLNAEELKLFDDIVLSSDVGMIKPDRDLFLLACSRLEVEPSEAVMVDDRQYNIDAANQVGMNGILYTDFTQFKRQLDRVLANPDN